MSMYPKTQPLDYGRDGTDSMVKIRFFNQVYAWMAVALLVTAITSYVCNLYGVVIKTPGIAAAAGLAAFAISWFTGTAAMRIGAGVATIMFMVYAILIGVAVSAIWIIYPRAIIGTAFGITSGIFLAASFLGFVLKADLSKLKSILIVAAMGLFVASIVNIFMANDFVSWMITYGIVVIFPILMVIETQQLNAFAETAGQNQDLANRMAIIGSLSLYISFINVFMAILRILGSRK